MKKIIDIQRIESGVYLINGVRRRCNRVTKGMNVDKVIKQYYNRWQSDINSKYYGMKKNEIKELWNSKRDTGIQLHDDIEQYYKSKYKIVSNTKLFKLFMNDFEKMRVSHGWRVKLIEDIVYYDGYIGRIDALFYSNDLGYILVDWKCRDEVRSTDIEQIRKYKDMVEHTYNITVSILYIVLIDINNGIEIIDV